MKTFGTKSLLLASTILVSTELHARLAGELINLPLEELMMLNISISSASKREQGYFDTPAPISVLTADQLESLGVTSIPEALRSLPGVQVGKIQTAGWSVSIRGLGGRFSRYLLILVDGRSVYDNLLNGVNWDEVNVNMKDIERIELVRGPSGMFWGANAVNGVINIITKKPTQIKNNSMELGTGNIQKEYATVQLSHSFTNETHLKVNANHIQREGMDYLKHDMDEGDQESQRFNIDLQHRYHDHQFDVAFDVFKSSNNEVWQDTRISTVVVKGDRGSVNMNQEKDGYAFQAKWRYQFSVDQSLATRFSYDTVERTTAMFSTDVKNTDFDIEYSTRLGRHLLSVGSNNRFSSSDYLDNNDFIFLLNSKTFEHDTNSFFINDVVHFGDDFELSFGGRYEDDSATDSHTQWSARGLWKINDNQRLWSAYSRSNSTPSILLLDGDMVDYKVFPPFSLSELQLDIASLPSQLQDIVAQNYARLFQPVPLILRGAPKGEHKNAVLDSFELGYRSIINDNLVFEISAFYNEYENLLIPEIDMNGLLQGGFAYLMGVSPVLFAPILHSDEGERKSTGVELSLFYKVNEKFSLQYSGDYINNFDEINFVANPFDFSAAATEVDNPAFSHRFNINWKFSNALSSNVLFRYVDSIASSGISAYAVADVAVHYEVSPGLKLSVIAQNLGDPHREAASEAFLIDITEYEQNILFKLDYQWGE